MQINDNRKVRKAEILRKYEIKYLSECRYTEVE